MNEERQQVRKSLIKSPEQLRTLWNDLELRQASLQPEGGAWPEYMWRTGEIEDGYILFTSPKIVETINETGQTIKTNGLCWQWQKEEQWLDRVWEAPLEWYAEYGPILPTSFNPVATNNPEIDERRTQPSEIREIFDPLFARVARKHRPKLRKRIRKLTKHNNPDRIRKLAKSEIEELFIQLNRRAWIARITIVICILIFAYNVGFFADNRHAEQMAGAYKDATKLASASGKSSDDCMKWALLEATPDCQGNAECIRKIVITYASQCLLVLASQDDSKVESFCRMDQHEFEKKYCKGSKKAEAVCYCAPPAKEDKNSTVVKNPALSAPATDADSASTSDAVCEKRDNYYEMIHLSLQNLACE